MKKKVLMVSLSLVMVLGLAGVVNATTIGNKTTNMQPQASNAKAYMDNTDVTSTEVEQVEPTQPDQTVPSNTAVYDQMRSSDMSMNDKMQNMPPDTQMQNMPMKDPSQSMPMNSQTNNQMNSQMNSQMNNPQHVQQMTGTSQPKNSNESNQVDPKLSGGHRMGSMGRMGR